MNSDTSSSGISFDNFTKCIEEIVALSDLISDSWQLKVDDSKENGKYITKKSTLTLNDNLKTVVTIEYNIAYNISYGVPVLCFNVWRLNGTLLTMEDYWQSNEELKHYNMYDTLTQMDHPVTCKPFLTLHPCKTHEVIEPFFGKTKNIVVSWLSVIGPFIHLDNLIEYYSLC